MHEDEDIELEIFHVVLKWLSFQERCIYYVTKKFCCSKVENMKNFLNLKTELLRLVMEMKLSHVDITPLRRHFVALKRKFCSLYEVNLR